MIEPILEILLQLVLEVCAELIPGLVWWLVLFPIVWVASAPFILLFGFFCSEPYWVAVCDMFASVHQFWLEQGAKF